jgi:hypothetical protein
MIDRWDVWADGWAAWNEAEAAGRPSGNGVAGYDRWKTDIGPWPSTGDDARPTRPHPVPSFWERTELDLSGTEIRSEPLVEPVLDLSGEEIRSAPDPDAVLDLADDVLDLAEEVVDLVDDVDDGTR